MSTIEVVPNKWASIGRLFGRLEVFLQAMEKQSRVRHTIKELNSLTDAELRDIGITRADIWNIAHGGFKNV